MSPQRCSHLCLRFATRPATTAMSLAADARRSWKVAAPARDARVRQKRKATWSEKSPEGRFRVYGYDEILARDKVSLDLSWLRDESLEDSANLPEPNVLAQEIADDL